MRAATPSMSAATSTRTAISAREYSELDPDGDPDLMLWTKELVDPEGDPETTIFRAIDTTGQVIKAETTAMKDYRIRIPEGTQGPVSVSVRLLFRPFKPHVLRNLGVGELVPLNPVFEMETFSGEVGVTAVGTFAARRPSAAPFHITSSGRRAQSRTDRPPRCGTGRARS